MAFLGLLKSNLLSILPSNLWNACKFLRVIRNVTSKFQFNLYKQMSVMNFWKADIITEVHDVLYCNTYVPLCCERSFWRDLLESVESSFFYSLPKSILQLQNILTGSRFFFWFFFIFFAHPCMGLWFVV